MRKTNRFSLGIGFLMAVILIITAAFPLFAQPNVEPPAGRETASITPQGQALTESQRAAIEKEYEVLLKTYELKYIKASDFLRLAKFYFISSSETKSTIIVQIRRKDIPDFEALLKKMDVEKRNVQFRVYAILASKELPSGDSSNSNYYRQSESKETTDKSLKKVLDEMKGLWNFEHFWIKSPAFLLAKDGSGTNRTKLIENARLELTISNIELRGSEPGKRIISVGEISVRQDLGNKTESLIDTNDITFKENGYLVVGVSGIDSGLQGSALILVINAEVK